VVVRRLSILLQPKDDDMTAAQPAPPPFGRTLAFAERALTARLREHLAELGTTPETWYVLSLVATRGPALDRDALRRDLEGSRTLDAASTIELLERLESEGLIRGDAQVDLTPEGDARYRSLRASIDAATAELLGAFEPRDVETTIRILRAVTERAEEPTRAA
jgi:DNA-binding MarR family transcriptional regulator